MLGVVWLFLAKHLAQAMPFVADLTSAGTSTLDAVAGGFRFVFFVVLLSTVFAYSSLSVYRVLEGYIAPAWLLRRMLRRQLGIWAELQRAQELARAGRAGVDPLLLERSEMYPDDKSLVMPTGLGNALKQMETFGKSRYYLDSQSVWYELLSTAPATTREDTEQARAPVDFFVSSIAHLVILAALGLLTAFVSAGGRTAGLATAVVSLSLVRPAYAGAVRNMKDWGKAVKALVNLGRVPMAHSLGIRPVSASLAHEREMWAQYFWTIEYNSARHADGLDDYRFWPDPESSLSDQDSASSS